MYVFGAGVSVVALIAPVAIMFEEKSASPENNEPADTVSPPVSDVTFAVS